MGPAPRHSTREVARDAVRAELSRAAFELFLRFGFDAVTVNDLAAAAGVSRSTFLRYFATKEDAALHALDTRGEELAQAVRDRPDAEDDWTALRRALDAVIGPYRDDVESALAATRLVNGTPALCARHLEKQHGWRPRLAAALAGRAGSGRRPVLADDVRSAAALDCLNVALERWTGSDGRLDLAELLDEAFDAFGARPAGSS